MVENLVSELEAQPIDGMLVPLQGIRAQSVRAQSVLAQIHGVLRGVAGGGIRPWRRSFPHNCSRIGHVGLARGSPGSLSRLETFPAKDGASLRRPEGHGRLASALRANG